MALISGSFNTSASNGRHLTFRWEQTSSDYAANTSLIYWELRGAGNSGYVVCGNFKVTLDNQVVYQSATRINVYPDTLIANGTYTYHHADDGAGFTAAAVEAGIYQNAVNCTGFSWMDLVDIPRASQPSISMVGATTGNLGTISVNTNRKSAAFTHTVKYVFGNASGTIATGVGDETTWTVPLSLATQIPNATKGTGTITVETYNGGTLVGTKSCGFTIAIPSSVVPTVAAPTVTEATSGLASKFGTFVQNKSTLRIVSSPSGALGSTIRECTVTVNGSTYRGTNITTHVVTASGSLTVSVKVTDSRGRTAAATKTITVTPYANPGIAAFSAVRCKSDGTADSGGTSLKVTMNFTLASVGNKNDKSYTVKMKANGSSSWTTVASGSVYSYNGSVVKTGVLDASKSYVVRLDVSDYFMAAAAETDVSASFRLVNYAASGKGIAFGKFSEKDAMEVGMPLEVIGSVTTTGSMVAKGVVNVGADAKVRMWENDEGGNIVIYSNTDDASERWEMDTLNGQFRFIHFDKDGYAIPMRLTKANPIFYMTLIMSGTTNSPSVRWTDGKRTVWAGTANGTGDFFIYDSTNSKSILRSNLDGTNTFNGLANGNLPLTGGKLTGTLTISQSGVSSSLFNASDALCINASSIQWVKIFCKEQVAIQHGSDQGHSWAGCSAGGFFTVSNSSVSLKENIEDITEERAKRVLGVRVVTFDYKEGVTSEQYRYNRSGVLAEPTEVICPEVINYDNGKPTGVQYDRFIPYLIKMVQIQQGEIDELKAGKQRIEERLAAIEERLGSIDQNITLQDAAMPGA